MVFSDEMRFSATNFASQSIIPTLCKYNISTSGYLEGESTIDNLISINQIINFEVVKPKQLIL